MEERFTASEAVEVNRLLAKELDRQVALGNWYPVVLGAEGVIGCEIETPGAATPRASR